MTEKMRYDVVVIGAGPGGYVAAIKASQLGKKVALIEKENLGGTCLNVGCIPTKTLIASSHVLHMVKEAEKFGVLTGPVSVQYEKMKERKDGVVVKIRSSLEGLIRSNKIDIFKGRASFTDAYTVKVQGNESVFITADRFIIATGSVPVDVAAFPCDHTHIFNSTSILEQTQLPKTLAVIGGGYIGCEFASLYAELGVKVTIIESLPALVGMLGKDISQALTTALKKKGVEVKTSAHVESVEIADSQVIIHLNQQEKVIAEKVLSSVGRKPYTESLNLQLAGVALSEKGAILVNDQMETNVPGIYAIGDVTAKVMLAHVASHQAITAAINACGGNSVMHYDAVPSVIFTSPEIAVVGMTLEEALAKGYPAVAGKFPFQALGKSVAAMQTDGFATTVIHQTTGQILGAQVIGEGASSLIGQMAVAIQNELTIACVTDTIHAHPTLAEVWLESGLLAQNTPIHFPPKVIRS